MDSDGLRESSFQPLGPDGMSFTSEILAHSAKPVARVLEIGSGTGETLRTLATMRPDWRFVGIDYSERNVIEARHRLAEQGLANRVEVVASDYLEAILSGPFDLIVAQSVLHLIDADDHVLYECLRRDVGSAGVIVASIPYDCFYNQVLWSIRRFMRRIRGPVTDALIETMARLLHPNVPRALLRQRIPYMYLAPKRFDGPVFRNRLKRFGNLDVIDAQDMRSRSLGQPRHRLLIIALSR